MRQGIRDFVGCRSIAVVGVSSSGKGFGAMAYKELKARGYDLLPMHPTASTLQGDPCHASLEALPRVPDGVLVIVPPDRGAEVLRSAAKAGVKRVWLQQGAESPELVALGSELGLSVAHGACALMYMQPARGVHAFHRFFVKLFGRLEPTDVPRLPAPQK